MRVSAQCAAAVMLAAAVLPVSWVPAGAQAPAVSAPSAAKAGRGDATAVLAAARQALGGEKKLAAVKTLTATGRTRQVRGDNLVPIEFELFIELPDKYVRKDEIPAQETGVTATGFNGDDLLQDPPPPAPPAAATPSAATPAGAAPAGGAPAGAPAGGGPAMPRPNPSAARVTTLKQDFTRLALGLFASSFPSYPLTFTYAAEAEAPQGKADVLEGKGPNNFTLRLFISRDTHLPLMVSWTPPVPQRGGPGRGAPGPGGAPGARGLPPGAPAGAQGGAGAPGAPPAGAPPAGAPPAGAPPAAAPPAGLPPGAPPGAQRGAPPAGAPGAPGAGAPAGPPENRLYFADYRDVDGMQFPFRLRRAVGADTVEETTFDRYKVNGKIDPKRFEVRK